MASCNLGSVVKARYVFAAVGSVGVILEKAIRAEGARVDREFEDWVISSVADYLALRRREGQASCVKQQLEDLIFRGEVGCEVESLMRIELDVTKVSSVEWEVSAQVVVGEGEHLIHGVLGLGNVSWESLPSGMRRDFVETAASQLHFAVYRR